MEKTKKPPFKLTTSNGIFYLVYAVVTVVLFFLFVDQPISRILKVLTQLVSAAFVSTVIGYLAWLFSFKQQKVGIWAFNAVILLLTFYITFKYLKALAIL